ncbi:hypothetical protein TARUN_845 [Trichoderma arundinaceum]|uniref:Cytochrome p450 n=1 Tax=Trichoderma arundinaceum TaxID=490622 RepID=A0A395NZ49_TRIAR|nr:hypothetical protein TARUN_845 [Trichoderma arundinaceum]
MNVSAANLIKAAVPESEGRNVRILSQNVSDHRDPDFLSKDFPRGPPKLYLTAESDDFDSVTIAEWQAEGFDVEYLPMGNGGEEYVQMLRKLGGKTSSFGSFGIIAFGDAASICLEHYHIMDNNPDFKLRLLIAYYPTAIPDPKGRFPNNISALVHLIAGKDIGITKQTQMIGIQGKRRTTRRTIQPGIGTGGLLHLAYPSYTYQAQLGFAEHDLEEYDIICADLAWSRSLSAARRAFGQTVDFEHVWEENVQGGIGVNELQEFYSRYFGNPKSLKLILLSRTIGADQIVDEIHVRFKHTQEMPWILPGVPATQKRVQILVVSIVTLRGGKLYHEHVYWDQASVLLQIGALDPNVLPEAARKIGINKMPIVGSEAASRVLKGWDPEEEGEADNELISGWHDDDVDEPLNGNAVGDDCDDKRVALGRFEHENIELHRKYGPVVRLAPNMYSIDLPEAVNAVYGIGSKLPKSEWYDGWKLPSPDAWTMFPDKDIKRHAQTRRVFQGLYSMSSLISYEKYVDECADVLLNRLCICSKSREPIDMGHWFQCYAFDVIGNITFSKPFGFLDRGEDVSGLLQALDKVIAYSTLIGIFSSLHPYVFAVTNFFGIGGAAGRTYLARYVKERIRQRKAEKYTMEEKLTAHVDGSPEDFLEKIMIKNKDAPSKVTDYHVFMMSMSNIVAGSDTTAISLSAILYYLLKYPTVMEKLREEVDQSTTSGGFTGAHLSFKASLEMPYWQAVMKEALRLHPATGLPLWRTVTEGGLELNGQFFPEGTTIGLNTWTAHYNETVFGKDAAVFRPERWLEAEKEEGDRIGQMNAYYLPFGLGSRTCIGRHISYLEMSKLIPLLVRNFDFELQLSEKEWQTTNYWFVKPNNFYVTVKARAA